MRVAIAGAGKVGRAIARELLQNGHEILLIDRDPALARPGVVEGAETLMADACEVTALEEARLSECQVVVAATGDDKVNLVVSLLAKTEFGVPRVVARVNHPKNEWMFDESWGGRRGCLNSTHPFSFGRRSSFRWRLGETIFLPPR